MSYPNTLWVIQDWSVTTRDDVYTPPECCRTSIQGRCLNRPGFDRGILTSPVVRVEGRRVFTENGSRYVLGRPAPSYVEWCRRHGHHVPTRKHPLLVKAPVSPAKPKPLRDSKGRFVRRAN